jgi:hypothetical protein
MEVSDIRPSELQSGQEAAYARDLERLRARLDEFVSVPCPACGSDDPAPAFAKYGFQFQHCRQCRTIFMSPRPSPEVMASYYDNSENYRYWAEHIFPASEASRREKIHRPMLEYVVEAAKRHGVPRGLLVEVGPGFGTFAALAKDAGSFDRVVTIERTPEMVTACRDRGLEVIDMPVEDIPPGKIEPANVVVSF